MFMLKPTYDTETVRQLLGLETPRKVWDLCRRGYSLHGTQVRRGSFDKRKIDILRAQFIRRRLAGKLGRISPRLIDNSHSRTCPECKGIAVEWEGRTLCEKGHTS